MTERMEALETAIHEELLSLLSAIIETATLVRRGEYDDARGRGIIVMTLHAYIHHVAELNDIICQIEGVPNPGRA